tara:strand:- start:258 stop:1262 length:1005 start_codon:yes stop_codon:yes gene_type:complete
MIVGVTGKYASGKDALAEILQKMGFFHVSLSDILREELIKRKKKTTRDNLIAIGNELREMSGSEVLARRALKNIRDGENYVFTSIRNPGEVELLKIRKDFVLVNVEAPETIRFKRILERKRESDPKTLKELRKKEKLENSTDKNKQQLEAVAKMAKVIINNNSSLDKLKEKVERFVNDWLFKLQDPRPDWDNYFMDIAEQVKMRSTCMSAKKGAIIARDKMIVSTGYNGTPKSIGHCNEGGCQRCTSRHLGKIKSGIYSEPCICVHSEANSIVQAAYNGVSTKEATMYTTFTPCVECAKLIINAGIKEVVAKVKYPDDEGTKLLENAGVILRTL